MVSQIDRRDLHPDDASGFVANLETTDVRSEDAVSSSHAHTELTREPYARTALMSVFMKHRIDDETAQKILEELEEKGAVSQEHLFSEVEEASQLEEGDAPPQEELHIAEVEEASQWEERDAPPQAPPRHVRRKFKKNSIMVNVLLYGFLICSDFVGKPGVLRSTTQRGTGSFPQVSDVFLEATGKGGLNKVRRLLAGGGRLKQDVLGPALRGAAHNGHAKVVSELLLAGADKSWKKFETTALHLAAESGHSEVVGILLHAGAKKDARDHSGRTALYLASHNGHFNVVRDLLDAKADPNRATFGKTPLHLAAANGHLEMVRELLHAGAKKDARDYSGRTPFDLAAANGHSKVRELLAGADKDK